MGIRRLESGTPVWVSMGWAVILGGAVGLLRLWLTGEG